MTNLPFKIMNTYRKQIKSELESYEGNIKAKVCNPVDYYNFEEQRHQSEREIMEFDLNKVRKCDLIIVNFNDPKSLGTMAELAIAYERRIPVVGLNVGELELHPWQWEMTTRIFSAMDEMMDYVKEFYLT